MITERTPHETHLVEWRESWRDESPTWLGGFARAAGGKPRLGMNDQREPIGAQDSVTAFRPPARRHDALLPRLLSGELAVDAAAREVKGMA